MQSLTLGEEVNKSISQNVGLFLQDIKVANKDIVDSNNMNISRASVFIPC